MIIYSFDVIAGTYNQSSIYSKGLSEHHTRAWIFVSTLTFSGHSSSTLIFHLSAMQEHKSSRTVDLFYSDEYIQTISLDAFRNISECTRNIPYDQLSSL